MPVPAKPKGLETNLHPFCESQKENWNLVFTTQWPVYGYKNYAKDTRGLFARIIGKISALTVLQYINYINGRPLGRIKYALN